MRADHNLSVARAEGRDDVPAVSPRLGAARSFDREPLHRIRNIGAAQQCNDYVEPLLVRTRRGLIAERDFEIGRLELAEGVGDRVARVPARLRYHIELRMCARRNECHR